MASEDKAQAPQTEDNVNLEREAAAAVESEVDNSADVDASDEPSNESLRQGLDQELEQAQLALQNAQDQVLRAQADVQNIRRRAEQDVSKARKFALEKFAEELIPVVDNLERGIESAQNDDADVKVIREGMEMTLISFVTALKKFNVEPVDPQNEPFDPQLHQAMSMVENDNVEPNTVLHVMQKGYQLNGRLVRPAMVMVSKGGVKKPATPSIDEKA
ncbi:MAG: nucleotide exchange factor GrpE [Halopseudomonas sp.]